MKKLFLLFLLLPNFAFSMHHKTDPIIFYLDLKIINKNIDVGEFLEGVVKTVKETEPGTQLYEFPRCTA